MPFIRAPALPLHDDGRGRLRGCSDDGRGHEPVGLPEDRGGAPLTAKTAANFAAVFAELLSDAIVGAAESCQAGAGYSSIIRVMESQLL